MKIIQELKDTNYSIYILSNNNKETANYLRKQEFYKNISGDIFSCDYGVMKPNPCIYNILLNEYNLAPEECLFIDDNQKNIDAAKKLKFKTLKYIPSDYNYTHDRIFELL